MGIPISSPVQPNTNSARKHLLVLLFSLFVISIGFGITLPVLPFYTQRLASSAGLTPRLIALHIGLLTSVFPLMQLLFAPLWGRLSDRFGRKPLFLLGIIGYGISQLLFGLSTSLWLLYGARILGGVLASATIPAATAYVADSTNDKARGRGMALLGAAISLGAVAGPAIGGLVVWKNWHISTRLGHLTVDSFSIPFFIASLLSFITLFAAIRWLPESMDKRLRSTRMVSIRTTWREIGDRIWPLLGLSILSQLGLTLFETVFVLYSQRKLGYGPSQVAIAFMVCGSVMALFQGIAVGYLAGRISEIKQLAIGFNLMGVGIALLLLVHALVLNLGAITLLALGLAFVAPNISTLTSKRSGLHMGTGLGLQTSAGYLGQTIGPFLGAILFAWRAAAPYTFAAILLLAIGIFIGRRAYFSKI